MERTHFFDYSKEYKMEIIPKTEGNSILFGKEGGHIPGKINVNVIQFTKLSSAVAKKRLSKTTRSKIKGLDEVQTFQVADEDLETGFSSSEEQSSSFVLIPSRKDCLIILKALSFSKFNQVQDEGVLQTVLCFFSLWPRAYPNISAAIHKLRDTVKIVDNFETDENILEVSSAFFKSSSAKEPKEIIKSFHEIIANKTSPPHTTEEIQFFAYICALGMSKTLIHPQFYTTWITLRKRAWEETLNINLKNYNLPFDLVQKFKQQIDRFPTLRSAIHQALISSLPHPGARHVLDMMVGSQMTLIFFILDFLGDPIKTHAHIYKPILDDLIIFFEHYDEIVNLYGENWKYFKLYCPDSQYFSYRSIPNLAFAAYYMASMCKRTNQYSIGNKKPITASIIETLCSINLPITSRLVSIIDDKYETVKKMQLELNDVRRYIESQPR